MREGAKVMHSRMRARTARPERFCILLGLLERPSQMDTKRREGVGPRLEMRERRMCT
jgi:hypothetical protein